MTVPVEKHRYTIAEYLQMEETARDRHEFHDGEILMMPGGTYRHSVITTNTLTTLANHLKGKPCRPLDSNMRVRIPTRRSYVYPDITIVCGPPVFDVDDPKETTIINPTVVIEVLSESTEAYDRTDKFDKYRDNPHMKEYVLISQKQPTVQTFLRQDDGSWRFNACQGMHGAAELRSVNLTLPLKEIYDGVNFEEASA